MVQHAGFEGFQIERGMLDRLQTALTSAAAAESDKQQYASATAQMTSEKNPLFAAPSMMHSMERFLQVHR